MMAITLLAMKVLGLITVPGLMMVGTRMKTTAVAVIKKDKQSSI